MWTLSERTQSAEAEKLLCCTVLAKPSLLDDITLSHEDFSDPDYGLIYRTARYLHERGKPVSDVDIVQRLASRVDVDKLTKACDIMAAQPWTIQSVVRVIRDAAARRRLIAAAQKMLRMAHEAEEIGVDQVSEAENAISEIASGVSNGGAFLLGDRIDEHFETLEARVRNQGGLTGVNTGFRMLNTWLGGWMPGYLCVVGARPGMGKTAFALHSAAKGAERDVVVVFSVEMVWHTLLDRMLAANGTVPLHNILHGQIRDDEWDRIIGSMDRLRHLNLYIDDNPYATVPYIRAQLRRIARKADGRRLVAFVDYLQIVKLTSKGRSRTEEIGQISSELKALANELDCCVVALAQVNRNVETRGDKRPVLADLRDSGQIEQDADVVMFLYRDEYYNPETERPNTLEIIVAKNRNGGLGTATVGFAKEWQKFTDIETRYGE